jgi:hypothetical protein
MMPSGGAFCLNRSHFLSAEVPSKVDYLFPNNSKDVWITSLSEESNENT